MIPITRKELYLNKIVGNNDYEIPEKPISEEELFFAEILGEAVQAPEPLTRYQMYLAKIAKRNIEIPYPKARLEYYLAKAAGMDITVPVPITREEIYWSNYTAIMEFEVENVPPLAYKAIEGTLKNYRIYGNTVNAASVGDRTGNLFSTDWMQGGINFETGNYVSAPHVICTENFIKVSPNTTYSISRTIYTSYIQIRGYDANKQYIGGGARVASKDNPLIDGEPFGVFTVTNNNVAYIKLNDMSNDLSTEYMMVEGSYTAKTMPSYEPYGYKVPVTVSNGTNTQTIPIYLPEQIRKVRDEAEYIDYGEQKFVKKFYKITLNFDDMNNDERFPGWSGGTAVVEYCNKIRSLAIVTPDSYIPFQYSSISNFKANFNVRSNRSVLYLGVSFDIGHTQSELKEIYAGRSITFILKIPDTDLDVTLPALPTLSGTNILSIGTTVQPSKVYIKGEKEREYT